MSGVDALRDVLTKPPTKKDIENSYKEHLQRRNREMEALTDEVASLRNEMRMRETLQEQMQARMQRAYAFAEAAEAAAQAEAEAPYYTRPPSSPIHPNLVHHPASHTVKARGLTTPLEEGHRVRTNASQKRSSVESTGTMLDEGDMIRTRRMRSSLLLLPAAPPRCHTPQPP